MRIRNAAIDKILDFFRKSRTGRWISYICIFALLNFASGCYYYKVVSQKETPAEVILQHQEDADFIMLHFGEQVWEFTDIELREDTLLGKISNFRGHDYYKTTRADQVNRYRHRMGRATDESDVLNEVHITIYEYIHLGENEISIPMESIEKIEIYNPAIGATVGTFFFSGLGIAAVAFGVFMLILIMTSCPFVYVFDGMDFAFSGEIYPGAIFPPLERHDYLPLHLLEQDNGSYRIRISNEVHEIQHTNLAELICVDHPCGTEIYIDKYGEVYGCQDIQSPVSAMNLKGKNILPEILERDSLLYTGEDPAKAMDLTDGTVMEFERPSGKNQARVIIKAKNSYWLDYVFDRFHELFGARYDTYMSKQAELDDEILKKRMLDHQLPASLFIERDGDWEFLDYFNLAGPIILRDDVLAIDLSGMDTGPIRIKLEYGTYFWELDYVGMDFTMDQDFTTRVLPVESAVDRNNEDVRDLLVKDDELYYVQPEIGDRAELVFAAPPPQDDLERSVFLHSKGHYKILRANPGKPQVRTLKFIRKHGLSKYSIDLVNHLYSARTDNSKLKTESE